MCCVELHDSVNEWHLARALRKSAGVTKVPWRPLAGASHGWPVEDTSVLKRLDVVPTPVEDIASLFSLYANVLQRSSSLHPREDYISNFPRDILTKIALTEERNVPSRRFRVRSTPEAS